ncbi:hypothetical protein [Streptomyces sp. NPDC089799]|uniref:hypothetical protein n=1 Tax=Streptomyces sp. NPDC089799 TaxID=3155066 RepID=UPI00342BBB41
MNKKLRVRAVGALVPVMSAATLLLSGSPASAFNKDGYLEKDEFGLYYTVNRTGCVFDLGSEDMNFSDNKFWGPSGCSGYQKITNDNTESYWNRDVFTWKVGTDKDMDGQVGTLPEGHVGNASATFKNKISSADYILGT